MGCSRAYANLRGKRWRIAKKKIHAKRRNRKKYRVNQEELVLFRAIGPE